MSHIEASVTRTFCQILIHVFINMRSQAIAAMNVSINHTCDYKTVIFGSNPVTKTINPRDSRHQSSLLCLILYDIGYQAYQVHQAN